MSTTKNALSKVNLILGGGCVVFALGFCTLAVAVIALLQDTVSSSDNSSIQATQVSILERQLGVQELIATKQAQMLAVSQGPTATALAIEIERLQATQDALANQGENSVENQDISTPVPPTSSLDLPFFDDFNDGLDSSWQIVDGDPVITNGQLSAISGSVTVEIGDNTLEDLVLEFDYYGFNNYRGINLYFSNLNFWMDYYRCSWSVFIDNNWDQFAGGCANPGTTVNGKLQVKVTGSKYSIFNDGLPFIEVVQGNPHKGPIRIAIAEGAYIDNVSITVP